MARTPSSRPPGAFLCQECGYRAPKWMGRCPGCSAWESLVEDLTSPRSRHSRLAPLSGAGTAAERYVDLDPEDTARQPSGLAELDRALGGGFVPGMLVLLGGEPGVGKSTLALQCAASLAGSGRAVLYVSGEESRAQVRLRGARLGLSPEHLYVLTAADIETIESEAERLGPTFAVVDSIQTVAIPDLPASPGSLVQVRECAVRLLGFAKARSLPLLLVGHVTKDGTLAGPKVLEHIVDTVLTLEGEPQHLHRILRCSKNRFGPADEAGMFAMTPSGLESLANPSQWFLRDRDARAPGSAVTVHREGSRPFLVEVQALAGRAAFGTPRRASVGVEAARLSLLVAVLERHTGLALGEVDLFVNAAGGVRLQEPAADLAVTCALASALTQQPLDPQAVVLGEVGLGGEVRSVPRLEERLREAGRCGFRRAVLPSRDAGAAGAAGLVSIPARSVAEALEQLIGLPHRAPAPTAGARGVRLPARPAAESS